jgi:peptidylprolyl isomerase
MSRLLSLFAVLPVLFAAALAGAQAPQSAVAPGIAPSPPPLEAENIWNLDLSTGGRVVIQLRPDIAPVHVERIKTLTRQGFYNGLAFFRVIEGFMAQGGDPNNLGTGGSTLPDLEPEIRGLLHVRGAVGMARAEALNSANSQFYIMFTPRLQMDRQYTLFGRVVGGMNFVDAIERGEPPPVPSRIVRASLGTDNLPPMSAEELRAAAERMTPARPAATIPGQAVEIVPMAPAQAPPPPL